MCLYGVFVTRRRKFSPEFKKEAVKLTLPPGISCSQVVLEIGVALSEKKYCIEHLACTIRWMVPSMNSLKSSIVIPYIYITLFLIYLKYLRFLGP